MPCALLEAEILLGSFGEEMSCMAEHLVPIRGGFPAAYVHFFQVFRSAQTGFIFEGKE